MNIEDILITPLNKVNVSGGDVMHAMKKTEVGYSGFGEAYFSFVSKGVIKAWKRHTRMTMNLVVPIGQIRFVFFMGNHDNINKFLVTEIGETNYSRITVPPGIWFGFQGCIKSQSLLLNIANIPHDPNEADRLEISDINFSWD